MKKVISIVELFSGIGAQAKALGSVANSRGYKMISLNTCEWDIHSIVAYDYIHNGIQTNIKALNLDKGQLLEKLRGFNLSNDGKEKISSNYLHSLNEGLLRTILSAIINTRNLVNIEDIVVEDLPDDIDIMTYSFPCQDLSNVGALHGYNKGIDKDSGSRSSLLWRVGNILIDRQKKKKKMPKFLLLENVTALEAKRHGKNFSEWQNILSNLGYINKIYKLNAKDFGLPQNRNRLLMVSILTSQKDIINEYFNNHDLNDPSYNKSLDIKGEALEKYLRLNYNNSIIFEEAKECQPNATKSRKTIWEKNSQIIDKLGDVKRIVQTITTKQDRHPNSGNIYFEYKNNIKSKYRFLTPRECFLLMGFEEKDYEVLINENLKTRKDSLFFSRDVKYRLAGNSIAVNVLKYIFDQIIDIYEILGMDCENESVG